MRDNIINAIAAGAPWESFRARSDAIEAAIAAATVRARELEAPTPPTDTSPC